MLFRYIFIISLFFHSVILAKEELPLFYWNESRFENFGDILSRELVNRIVQKPLSCYVKKNKHQDQKLLAIGSILYFANDDDVVWGSGLNGKTPTKDSYDFTYLDVRAVRGPITRKFLIDNFGIECPPIYGDPGLLFPYFFPEFQKNPEPSRDYVVVLHYTDEPFFRGFDDPHIVYATDHWEEVLMTILDSQFVISTSLHGIVLAEAYGIPAQLLRLQESPHNHILKYHDYYLGTGRRSFKAARSVEEALDLGGELPGFCDLEKLYQAFPFEYWPNTTFYHPNFNDPPCFSCP